MTCIVVPLCFASITQSYYISCIVLRFDINVQQTVGREETKQKKTCKKPPTKQPNKQTNTKCLSHWVFWFMPSYVSSCCLYIHQKLDGLQSVTIEINSFGIVLQGLQDFIWLIYFNVWLFHLFKRYLDVSVNHSGGHTVSIYKMFNIHFQGPSEENDFTNLLLSKI